MVAKAKAKHIKIAPRKLRLVSGLVRGKGINDALIALKFCPRKKAAQAISSVLESAVANAEQTGKVDVDNLFISSLCVDQGATMKRFMPRAQGRAYRILKKTSHISVELGEK